MWPMYLFRFAPRSVGCREERQKQEQKGRKELAHAAEKRHQRGTRSKEDKTPPAVQAHAEERKDTGS